MVMRKLLFIIFVFISFNSFADCGSDHSSNLLKSKTFTNEIFKKAQAEGRTVVINSWNKTCSTCAKQMKILDQAKKENYYPIIVDAKTNENSSEKIAKVIVESGWGLRNLTPLPMTLEEIFLQLTQEN